jgi:hypothetical protein
MLPCTHSPRTAVADPARDRRRERPAFPHPLHAYFPALPQPKGAAGQEFRDLDLQALPEVNSRKVDFSTMLPVHPNCE